MPDGAIRTFSHVPTIDGGFDVICDLTGHPVDHRQSAQSAAGVAYALNGAARFGSLTNAWGSHDRKRAIQ